MDSVKWVDLTEEHLPQVLAIEKLVYPTPWSELAFRSEISKPYSVCLVALLDQKVIGYGCMNVTLEEAHILNIAVAPPYQRKKLGTAMMLRLLEEARKRGALSCYLEVRVSNLPACSLYRKLGFETVGTRKRYYKDQEDAYVMRLHHLQAWKPPF
jgi:ribosomal-protein-alanine N-acetyltransferase